LSPFEMIQLPLLSYVFEIHSFYLFNTFL